VRRFPRPSMRRVVIIVPSLFTLFNLFFGVWSMAVSYTHLTLPTICSV